MFTAFRLLFRLQTHTSSFKTNIRSWALWSESGSADIFLANEQVDEDSIVESKSRRKTKKVPLPFFSIPYPYTLCNRTISSRRELHQRGTTTKSHCSRSYRHRSSCCYSVAPVGRLRWLLRSNAPVIKCLSFPIKTDYIESNFEEWQIVMSLWRHPTLLPWQSYDICSLIILHSIFLFQDFTLNCNRIDLLE